MRMVHQLSQILSSLTLQPLVLSQAQLIKRVDIYHRVSCSKVFKSSVGVDREIGINERFIDLNRVSENVPKIQKITGSVIKSSDFSKMPSSGLRMSD